PDEDLPGTQQVTAMTRLMTEQIERRRDFYLALVNGHGPADRRVSEVVHSVREGNTDRVMRALGLAAPARVVVRGWWAYVEDRALSWSGEPASRRSCTLEELTAEGVAALEALLEVSASRPGR